MAEYDSLATTIGKMKRAAIDCWMSDQDFDITWGNDSSYNKWGWAPYQYHRPDANGEGGGTSVGYGDGVNCEASFNNIRARIDGIIEKWLGLPSGELCETPQADVHTAAAVLGSSATGTSIQGSGSIARSSSTVNDVVLGNMKGAFRAPFLWKYYTKFCTVQDGLGQAGVILQANYAAERAMWPAVKEDVAKICDQALSAWNTQVGLAASENAKFQLAVAGAVVTAVAAIVTAPAGGVGGAAIALAVTSAGISTAVAKVSEDAAVHVSGNSYESIMTSFENALKKLNESITAQETALNKALTEAVTTMNGDLASYNLDRVALGDFHVGDGSIKMDETDSTIVTNNMQLVEDGLSQALSAIKTGPSSAPTPREYGVGISSQGTHPAASALHELTRRCLELTHAEYQRGHGLFDATVADYFHTNAHARQTLRGLISNEALTVEL
ncbi:hypothetical protein [Schumannella soli]|uniref:Uncharacterized protein n=1 Tax=Schumannella soli TaxID=2590779 RepID=A0A506Y862_9MICO|nr:hypothetical protein [Schumannella soli]TPW77387.1 hypothetical protein FJ657_01485 [Schumannella soli]